MDLGEVYCKIGGYPKSEYFLDVTLVESPNESFFTACKAHCLTIPGAISFTIKSNICGCFSAGA